MKVAVIWKHTLASPSAGLARGRRELTHIVRLPRGARILDVQLQGDAICLWVLVDPDEIVAVDRIVFILGTGWHVDAAVIGICEHLATIQDGALVWHVFIEPEPAS